MTKNELEKENKQLKEQVRKYKNLLFLGVRNTVVLPRGLLLGKSEKEVCEMTIATIKEMEKNADISLIDKMVEVGEEEYARLRK